MSVGPAQHQQHHFLEGLKKKPKTKQTNPVPIKIVPEAFGQWAADGWSQKDKLKQKVRWRDDSSSAGGREPESPLVIGT